MERERRRLIAEALAAPPPDPGGCPLRTLCFVGRDVRLRVPPPNYMRTFHIREAHEVAAKAEGGSASYNARFQAEIARLQDAQPWFWDQLWPGGIALASFLLERPELVDGCRVLEFGTGTGLLAVCTALAGATCVVATDVEPKALAFVAQNAAENRVESCVRPSMPWDWHDAPPADVASAAPFDVVLLPDVMYDARAVERLAELAPQMLRRGGRLILADGTDRTYGATHAAKLVHLLCDGGGGFNVQSRHERRAGASTEDGGSAPDRPVEIICMRRDASPRQEQRTAHPPEADGARKVDVVDGTREAVGAREVGGAHNHGCSATPWLQASPAEEVHPNKGPAPDKEAHDEASAPGEACGADVPPMRWRSPGSISCELGAPRWISCELGGEAALQLVLDLPDEIESLSSLDLRLDGEAIILIVGANSVPLRLRWPQAVDAESAVAKFRRRARELRVTAALRDGIRGLAWNSATRTTAPVCSLTPLH